MTAAEEVREGRAVWWLARDERVAWRAGRRAECGSGEVIFEILVHKI
jgi:hypothetical protein